MARTFETGVLSGQEAHRQIPGAFDDRPEAARETAPETVPETVPEAARETVRRRSPAVRVRGRR
ncbi:hypothetical protein [Streptomyces jumonjinensis]|uniref:Uncharacterized protein n=1 Tax=Streptomyces jumonjinensis TaxID=1945 RepID=A0A646KIN7_STRJU|nr:hypothetical protein [Streptomyces jumonjinensis]MQT02073.1 hypothetical protein [Streptomyces jumonjinensis]